MARRIVYEPPRYPIQPWLFNVADLRPQGNAELVIEHGTVESVHGWVILGLTTAALLRIHGTRDGTVTASIEGLTTSCASARRTPG